MTITRLVAYTANGASLGPLPTPQDYSASFVVNDVGALTIAYPLTAPRSNLLGSPCEVAVEVSHDLGATWSEPPDGRYLYLRDARDRVKRDAYSVECPSYGWVLTKALVPPTGLSADGQRTFTDATDGTILRTLFDEAKARGALAGVTYTFTGAVDSDGDAWTAPAQTIGYTPGQNFLAILQDMVALGRIMWRFVGRELQVFGGVDAKGTNPMNADKAAGTVLRYGRDLTEAPFRRTWEGLASDVFVVGDNLATRTVTNAGATKPWGRWEDYVSAAGVDQAGSLDVIGNTHLSRTSGPRAEHTFGLAFRSGSPQALPFRDYGLGQYVGVSVDGTPAESMRVHQITLTRDNQGAHGGNLVLGDRFLEADVRAARALQSLTGGSSGGTSGTPTVTVGNDILAPAAPTGLTVTTSSYLDGAVPRAATFHDWADVTTNADGTAATDVAVYETWYRTTTTGTWLFGTRTTVSNSSLAGWTPGQYLEVRVRAIDNVGNEGAWSAAWTGYAAVDNTVPPPPSAPTVTSRVGSFKITWDGKSNTGGAMPADFTQVAVHRGLSAADAPSAANLVGYLAAASEVFVDVAPAYGVDYYYRLVAADRSGNTSPVGPASGPHQLSQATSGDVGPRVIVADHLESTMVLTNRMIAGTATGNRVELQSTGLLAYGPGPVNGVTTPGAKNTVRIDADTGNATFLGEVGTAPPGEMGIFLYSTTFSYAGTIRTRPVLQMNTGTTRDQPSIQAEGAGLLLYSGANTGEREASIAVNKDQVHCWIEDAADSGAVGSYWELTPSRFRAVVQGGTTFDAQAQSYLIHTPFNITAAGWRAATYNVESGGNFYHYSGFQTSANARQGIWVALNTAVTAHCGGGPFEVKNGDGSAWRDVHARAFTVQSDRAVKRNITPPTTSGLEVLRQAPTYEWEYVQDPGQRKRGPMAQDLPAELVGESVTPLGEYPAGLKMLDLYQLLTTTIQAVQELDAEFDRFRPGKPLRKPLRL